jgi:hypothetical protein
VKRSRSKTASRRRPPTELDLQVALNVMSWRGERGWSIAELAERADLPVITITRIEAAQRPATTVAEHEAIADCFGKSISQLWGPRRCQRCGTSITPLLGRVG